jgi:hypothetical protein
MDQTSFQHDDSKQKRVEAESVRRTKEKGVTWVKDTGIRMGDARKAGRKELAYGCSRSEGAPQANEPKRSAHKNIVLTAIVPSGVFVTFFYFRECFRASGLKRLVF